MCRLKSAPQAAGCVSLAEAALRCPTERRKQRDFAYRRSIKYRFKAEIHHLLRVQTAAATEHLMLYLLKMSHLIVVGMQRKCQDQATTTQMY